MVEIDGSVLKELAMAVREALDIDQRVLCNSCLLCKDRDVIRLLPFGWHMESNALRAQMCTSVLSRISGLCNDCIRIITDTRIVQHTGLTPDGLRGMRLIIYIGMLADRGGWDLNKTYQIPAELAATADMYQTHGLDPGLWVLDKKGIPLHPMIIQQREACTVPGDMVVDFIRAMKKSLRRHGNLQRCCILCRKQLPVRWMVILCIVCEHKLLGGGGREMLTLRGIELVYLLHRLVEDIHSRRLQGDFSIPSVEVDAIMEERMRSVIAELESDDDWWLQVPLPGAHPIHGGRPPGGAFSSHPTEGVHSCPSNASACSDSGTLRNSRAARLSRLAEASRIQTPHPPPGAGGWRGCT